MTTTPSEVNVDELRRRARRRLLGAIVLALAAAVFVPMLLESDPKPLGEDVAVRIPPVDDGKFVNRLNEQSKADSAKPAGSAKVDAKADSAKLDLPRSDAASSAPATADGKGPGTEASKDPAKEAAAREAAARDTAAATAALNGESPKDAATAEPKEGAPAARRTIADAEQKMLGTPAKAPTLAPSTAGTGTKAPEAATAPPVADAAAPGYSVQLAAFADDKGANSLANKLKRAGYPAYTEPLTTSRGTLWRVRVGPYATRDAAAVGRDKLKGEGYSGIVAPSK